MRDTLVLAIFVPWALMSLRRPWLGVLLWTWISLMNPHRLGWGFAYSAPLAAVAAGVTLIGMAATKERDSPFKGAPVTFFFLFAGWMTLSWLMGVDVEGDYDQWNKVMKIFFMLFVTLALLRDKPHILAFVWVTVGSLAALGVKGGVFTVLNGGNYRVWGPPGSFIEDNNEFALALVMTIPLLHFLQLQVQRRWLRHALSCAMLLCAASALGSHSRGGMLAISAMGMLFWWRSRRKLAMAALICVVLLAILPMMPDAWWNRMGTIATYEEDGSAMGRLYAWRVAWNVATHRFFGGGMSYQSPLLFLLYGEGDAEIIRAAHSIYFQILGNHGFVGLFLFLLMWFSTYRQAGWLRKTALSTPQARWASDLGNMIQVSLAGYAVGGAFLSLAYFDLPYDMMAMAVLARRWIETRGWERDPAASPLAYALRGRPKSAPGGPRGARVGPSGI
ncbi:MAG: putative O-glycosylation ligase, exosortase A system-associated [Candidatus Accumulibacter sp.]|jgi:probable O-glycosylation ligase (exosortase A-associated)|nr:putative O-glycosylation ligase, exosortase A system-associated [Accumulibacter sp.]